VVAVRFKLGYALVAVLVLSALSLRAQDPRVAIQQKLLAQYSLTTPTADMADIVTAGSVVMLQKPGLLMYAVADGVPPQSAYKGGKIVQTFGATFSAGMKLNRKVPGTTTATVPQRKFVPGEKFWVTAVTVEEDGVVLQLYSDPYNDVRYFGELKFPFQKNSPPPADQLVNTVAEVFTAQGGEAPARNQQQVGAAPQQAVPQPAMAPIAPPPPPPDAAPPPPKTIAVGQTMDQVTETFGQPQKVVKLGAKEIHYYPDMKVTFVNGKVADVE
jgi:hypothetical protein